MANNNSSLNHAKEVKNDEFYTQLVDIENELRHYKEHFKGKTVLCNCDDPRVSNFFRYFTLNFEALGLKKVIATCYKNCEPDLFSQNNCDHSIYIVYEGDKNGNKIPDPSEMEVHPLKGDGDFRSEECINLLKEANLAVTNPPFSLFREYVAHLMKYNKKFLIIGSINAISYKEVFPLLKNNQIWLGYNSVKTFKTPSGEEQVFGNIGWFTNLETSKRHEDLILYKHYTPEEYPTYDNFDAINVDKVGEIPMDYDGVMGVPLSFLSVHNPDQFEIIGYGKGELARSVGVTGNYRGRCDLAITKQDGSHTCPYGRILIKRK